MQNAKIKYATHFCTMTKQQKLLVKNKFRKINKFIMEYILKKIYINSTFLVMAKISPES